MGESALLTTCEGSKEGNAMRRVLSGFWFVLLLASPLAGQTNAWKPYKNAEGNFTVLFPGDPTDTPNKAEGSHTLIARDDSAIYSIIYTTMKSEQKVDEATFGLFKDAVFHEFPKCALVSDHAATPDLTGFIGHWYQLSCEVPNKVTIVGNLYWGKFCSYAVVARFPTGTAEPSKAIKRFADSFAVISPEK